MRKRITDVVRLVKIKVNFIGIWAGGDTRGGRQLKLRQVHLCASVMKSDNSGSLGSLFVMFL